MTRAERRVIEARMLQASRKAGCAVGYFDNGDISCCNLHDVSYLVGHELAIADATGLNGDPQTLVVWLPPKGARGNA